ncbi:DMT family transporter [Hoylesella nanceiensis]|uniref:DMT family transporter n=1 Tax=Hoylesella nanceiensis TaxID=425941 RepID=UPI001CB2FC34|nr:DMT family transporter [Hoylesella nanceiensis]MBF1434868.1 EamA family transporter [Hoylesella nanceiensis]
MWLLGAFISAAFLGVYDVFKKKALSDNAVIPVLLLNTIFSSLIFIPFILLSAFTNVLDDSLFYVPTIGFEQHKYVFLKSIIVLSSWVFGYFSMKHLPLTIVGPINATRPVLVLLGAIFVYGEHLNLYQWIGVSLAICSFIFLSRTGHKEGINFKHDKWIYFLVLAAILGAISGLYDKYLMAPVISGGLGFDKMVVQSWFNIYQMMWMSLVFLFLWYPFRHKVAPFKWNYYIIGISIFLCLADFVYFYSLSLEGAMISIMSMVRRGSVIVSFAFGALVLHEKNLKGKFFDLLFIIIGMIFLYLGTK